MALTAFQIANKLLGTENQVAPTFETPAQAKVRFGTTMPIANVDVVQAEAKAAADARVARRNSGKES